MCLEAVYSELHLRVETLARQPPPYKASPPQAATAATTLALENQTLKRDATHASGALSRSQKRAETLERKMQALELENEQGLLDRDRLQGDIEMLGENVEELRRERDEARLELRRCSAQWSCIIGNAAKIERGLWEELKKRQAVDPVAEAEKAQCSACKGNVVRLLEMNRALKRRVETLERTIERLKSGGREMGVLAQKLGELNGQLEGEIAKVLVGGYPSTLS